MAQTVPITPQSRHELANMWRAIKPTFNRARYFRLIVTTLYWCRARSREFANTIAMPNFSSLILPLALLLPQPADDVPHAPEQPRPSVNEELWGLTPDAQPSQPQPAQGWILFDAQTSFPIQHQVRVERRVIIRVSPRRPARTDLTATLPRGEIPKNMVERKIGKCLPVNGIAGVMPTQDNRLMLFMRDQRIIAANLEKACSARDYYSGFYVEPSRDGNICVDRDKLQSRTGAKCELSRIRQLIRVDT